MSKAVRAEPRLSITTIKSSFHCRALRAGDGFFIAELVFNSHPSLSAKVLLPSKREEASTENNDWDENPATAVVIVSITSKPLDITHAVASPPCAPRNCLFPIRSKIISAANFSRVHHIGIFGTAIRKIKR